MKAILAVAIVMAAIGTASAQGFGSSYGGSNLGSSYGTGSNSSSHYVQPHTTRDGTYVEGLQKRPLQRTQIHG